MSFTFFFRSFLLSFFFFVQFQKMSFPLTKQRKNLDNVILFTIIFAKNLCSPPWSGFHFLKFPSSPFYFSNSSPEMAELAFFPIILLPNFFFRFYSINCIHVFTFFSASVWLEILWRMNYRLIILAFRDNLLTDASRWLAVGLYFDNISSSFCKKTLPYIVTMTKIRACNRTEIHGPFGVRHQGVLTA